MAARKHPDRPLYVAIPRDLTRQPAFRSMSRDAQWLLQDLERDPFRLNCGVFLFNPRRVAGDAGADESEVATWFDELIAGGWVIEDPETGESWLTRHIEWDYGLASLNQAKGLTRDLKRVSSTLITEAVLGLVFDAYPALAPIDPGWVATSEGVSEDVAGTPSEGVSEDVAGTPSEGVSEDVAGTPSEPKKQEAQARSTKQEARSNEPEANGNEHRAQSPEPTPGATRPGKATSCDECIDGLNRSTGRPCGCARGRQVAREVMLA